MPRSARRLAVSLLLAFGLVAVAAPAHAEKKQQQKEDEIDYVALAARLVGDGHYDRAELTLAEVEPAAEGVDTKLYWVLRGLISLNKQTYADAATSFEHAIAAGNTDPLVFINLARAKFGNKDYRGAVQALDRAGPTALAQPQAEMLKSRAYWEMGATGQALEVLARARVRFRDNIELPRTEIAYLIELGLFQELARRRADFLARRDIEAEDLAAIAEALRHSGQRDEAKQSLEAARLRFPNDEKLTVQLARVYMDSGELLASAMLLEQAARLDSAFLVEAAELYRRAGRLQRALYINARIPEQQVKMKQRLQILLELEDFEKISAMEARLSRLGLLDDEQIRYALAYGFFQIRDFPAAERHLEQLQDPDLFRKGIELRKAIESCKQAGWLCQ